MNDAAGPVFSGSRNENPVGHAGPIGIFYVPKGLIVNKIRV